MQTLAGFLETGLGLSNISKRDQLPHQSIHSLRLDVQSGGNQSGVPSKTLHPKKSMNKLQLWIHVESCDLLRGSFNLGSTEVTFGPGLFATDGLDPGPDLFATLRMSAALELEQEQGEGCFIFREVQRTNQGKELVRIQMSALFQNVGEKRWMQARELGKSVQGPTRPGFFPAPSPISDELAIA